MNTDEHGLTEKIIGAASNTLGTGFMEKVYENSLAYELRQMGFKVEQQKLVAVHFRSILVGEYVADMLVEDEILVELKAVRALEDAHLAQCLNYLRATGLRRGLLLNFGTSKVQVKRVVHGF
jgi:GxxExxY protein